MDLIQERESLISEINKISTVTKEKLKPLIQKLADNISRSLDRPEVKVWAKNEGIDEPKISDVARIIMRLKKKHGWGFGKTALYDYIQNEYKNTLKEESEENKPVRLTDDYIKNNSEELLERIKDLKRGPAKDIRTKIRKETIDTQGWTSLIAYELVQLAKKIEEDENVDKELEKEIAEKIRMARDGRFATTFTRYEAIIAATNMTKSLTHAIAEEQRPLTRDEIQKNESNCRECFCSGSPKDKCNCHCHRTIQEMTTKGLKWAIKHNKRIGEYNEHLKRLANMDEEDICPAMKRLFTNPNMDKHLSEDDKMNLFTRHIEREKCIKCEMFLDEHPEFFKSKQ